MKKVKQTIQEQEYKTLINFVENNPTMRENTRGNYKRLFTLLYYTGMRINEVATLTCSDIQTGIKNKTLIIQAHKQKKEREVLLTPTAIKALKTLFDEEEPQHKVIRPKGNPFNSVSQAGFIQETNKTIKKVLGDRYTSHSFRSGLITELGIKNINPKVIQAFIGHKNITTTMNYINPSENDIRSALQR